LLGADAAEGDVSLEIVFAFDRGPGEAAKHGDLADVSKGVGQRSLEEAFGRGVERFFGAEIIVKLFHSGKEAIEFRVPGQRSGIVPGLLALGDGESPVKEIAHVGEDLRGSARFVSDVEAGEMVGGVVQSFGAAVGDGGHGVAKELTGGIS